jgi:hypothetical protein
MRAKYGIELTGTSDLRKSREIEREREKGEEIYMLVVELPKLDGPIIIMMIYIYAK